MKDSECETHETLVQEFDAARVTISMDKIERWRLKGLLPGVERVWLGGPAGSETRYPIGTARQAIELARLLGNKRDFKTAGWELWWRDYPVTEEWWRPVLEDTAKTLDKGQRFFVREARKDEEKLLRTKSVADRLAEKPITGFPVGRVKQRLNTEQRATFFGVCTQVAVGEFDSFTALEGNSFSDEDALLQGLGHLNDDGVLGHRLGSEGVIGPVLAAFAEIWKRESASSFFKRTPEAAIISARNDVRKAFNTAEAMYDATHWLFGRNALGLDLTVLVARHGPRLAKAVLIIVFAMVREDSQVFRSSTEIDNLLADAVAMRDKSTELRRLLEAPPAGLEDILTMPKLRRAAQSEDAMSQYVKEIEARRGNCELS
jgi:hypothetical protein